MKFIDEFPKPDRTSWVVVADELKENPGRWGLITADASDGEANTSRTALARYGCKVRQRRTDEGLQLWGIYENGSGPA